MTLQGEVRRIFAGWMFAASPGLNAVEHPIYDVWLTDCKQPLVKVAEDPGSAPQAGTPHHQRRRSAGCAAPRLKRHNSSARVRRLSRNNNSSGPLEFNRAFPAPIR